MIRLYPGLVALLLILPSCASSRATVASGPGNAADGGGVEAQTSPDTHAGMDHSAHMSAGPSLPATAGPGYTVADVRFMQDMIGHHAQALVMVDMAASRGASPQILQLAEKIDISQRDEIVFMQDWLRERGQAVPTDAQAAAMFMHGMLTPQQLDELRAARGGDFDRLFLRYMIQHHTGALHMVEALFAAPGAAQDPDIFRFVTDVSADQEDEIGVMQYMLTLLNPTQETPIR